MSAPTLPQVIAQLSAELVTVRSELQALKAEDWLSQPGRRLANREQELHTTLVVLQEFQK